MPTVSQRTRDAAHEWRRAIGMYAAGMHADTAW
jgi:hypothetical protein